VSVMIDTVRRDSPARVAGPPPAGVDGQGVGTPVAPLTSARPAADDSWVTRDGSRLTRLGLLVAGTAAVGLPAAAAVMLLAGSSHAVHVPVHRGWLAALLLGVTVAGELTAVRLRHGDSVDELTLFEAAVVADALLLDPLAAIAVPLAALLLVVVAQRRPWVKAAFDIGAHLLGIALTVGGVAAFAEPAAGLRAGGTVLGLLLGTLASTVVTLLARGVAVAAATGVPPGATLRDRWRLSLVMAVGTVGLGATAVAVAQVAPLLLPFSLLPAAALTYAYSSVAQEGDERVRSQQLLALSHHMAGATDVEDLVTSFLALVREAFRAETAFVVLESAGREETVVAATAAGVVVRGAHPAERALLATAGSGTELLASAATVDGPARILLAPLDAEGRRLGIVALTEPVPATTRLSFARLAGTTERSCELDPAAARVVGPLASALAVALRAAEHLARLTEETDKLQQVVDHSSDGIVVLDGAGAVAVWSPAMVALTGVQEAGALGRSLSDVVDARDESGRPLDALRAGWDALTAAAPRATVETALLRADGEQRSVRWSHAAVFDAPGDAPADAPADAPGDAPADAPADRPPPALLRDVVLVHDVTRERQVDRLKSDFIATVSHELRSPITPIKGYVALLRRKGEEFTPEKRAEILDHVGDRVAHLTRIVEDVLLASRVASPASTVEMATGDLGALARKSAGDFSLEAGRLRLELPAAAVPVACDPVRVVQVVSNMISNAVKYSPAGTPVRLQVWTEEGPNGATALLTVVDQGRGIPADQLEAVFEKFHRVEDPMRMTTGGTGLGLYIGRELAEAMGGTLTVSSTYGAGSTFTFALPLLPADATVVLPAARHGAWPPLPPRTRWVSAP